MAKTLDKQGTGMIARNDLQAWVLSLGVNIRTLQRWMNEARNHDLFIDMQAKGGQWLLRLPNAGLAAVAIKCESVGRKVTMKASALIGKGWKARIGGAYEAIYKGRPITRDAMQKLSNVPVSTQRYRDRQAGVNRTRNYSRSNMRGDMLQGVKEYTQHKGVYLAGDGRIYWRLPNSYQVSFAMRGGKGRARKAKKIIRQLSQNHDGLFQRQQALSFDSGQEQGEFIRLFHYTPATRKATQRKLARIDQKTDILEVYELAGQAKTGAAIWTHCPA